MLAFVIINVTGFGRVESNAIETPIQTGTTSPSGWINFTPYTNLGIYLPITVNGHATMAWLYGGPSNIDKSFAQSLGLQPDAAGSITGLEVRIGSLILGGATAKSVDLHPEVSAALIGKSAAFWLGEEVFNRCSVDIDYPNHRVAFSDANTTLKLAGATEIPLIEVNGERVVPLSINGAPPGQFELELGNVTGPLLVTPAYAKTHNLLEGRPTSQRLSGPFTETVVTIDRLTLAGVDFSKVPIAIIPDSEVPPDPIVGGMGLPMLATFRAVIDYLHNRMMVIPDSKAGPAIQKDRIGMVVRTQGHDFIVVFVSPNSPAAAAGFKKGDTIAQIDGKSFDAWPLEAIVRIQMTNAGTTHNFTMPDGSVRQVTATDFF